MKDLNVDIDDVGFDITAVPGMAESEIQTPALVLDLDALERNVKKMGDYAKANGITFVSYFQSTRGADWRLLDARSVNAWSALVAGNPR